MRRFLRVIALTTAASVAAVVLSGWLLAPPRHQPIQRASQWSDLPPVASGAFHVHTIRSDGTGTLDEVAAAAARAGLQFVVFTDHGDGTRPRANPRYRSGVLCLDGVEISTTGGHYIALDFESPSYPLAGEARDVVEDVARLGGFGVVAHPTSEKADLAWKEWSAPFDGLEWLNGDSEWRDEAVPTLVRSLLTYLFRPAETLGSLLDRPALSLSRWDALIRRRRIVALAGADAHARISLDEPDGGGAPPFQIEAPSYHQLFQTFAIRAELEAPLTGDALRDSAVVIQALRQGRVYTAVDALATPPYFTASATSGGAKAGIGEVLPLAGPVTISVRSARPSAGGQLVLLQDGKEVASDGGESLSFSAPARRAVYRAEVRLAGAPGNPPVPWIVSNPIYVGFPTEPERAPPRRPSVTTRRLSLTGSGRVQWTIERDASSSGYADDLPANRREALRFRYELADGRPPGIYVALVIHSLPSVAAGRDGHPTSDFADRLSFTGRADRPMRVSVQIRIRETGGDERWQRSVYLEPLARPITIFFDEMRPVSRRDGSGAPRERIDALLFLVDTLNARPGDRGEIWIEDLRFERAAAP